MNSNKNMKRPLASLLVLSLSLAHVNVWAQESFLGPLNTDVEFNNGVLLQGITSSSEGVSSVALEGTGSLTVSSAAGGGFPRLMVVGGTTITSTRTFSSEEINKTTWSGQFDAPGSSVKPGFFDINDPGAGFADDYEATDAFSIGLANETFGFSSGAEIVFPTGQQNGQKLYVSTEKDDATWDVDKAQFCIVSDGLCTLSLTSLNKIALIKELFESCPAEQIANGTVGSTPSCNITCNSGFELNEDGNGCVEAVAVENFEEQFTETTTETGLGDDQFFENEIVAPAKEYEFPPGHFRYRASSEKFYRALDETGLTATFDDEGRIEKYSDLGLARHHNTTYLSRNPRTAEEQIAARNSTGEKTAAEQKSEDESFTAYLIRMRNYFGAGSQENNYTALSAEGGSDSSDEGEEGEGGAAVGGFEGEDEGGEFLSSGPLLPSTGPGIFVTIAVVGFALMLFGARRS